MLYLDCLYTNVSLVKPKLSEKNNPLVILETFFYNGINLKKEINDE